MQIAQTLQFRPPLRGGRAPRRSVFPSRWSSHLSAWSCRLAAALAGSPPPHVRFFAGIPLLGDGGLVLGSLSLVASEPRTPTDEQCTAFTELAGEFFVTYAAASIAGDSSLQLVSASAF